MKTKTIITALSIFLFLGLTGCGSAISPLAKLVLPDFAIFEDEITSQGAEPVLDRDEFEKINLIEELKAGLPSSETSGDQDDEPSSADFDPYGNKVRKELAKAFESFNKNGTQKRRNAIQERVLAASNQRCAEFKNYLRQFQAEVNFGLGTATTALAGLGAIFTPASTVRALSGAAAITSGVRAEFEENFFYTLATHVITEGIDTKREEIYKKIRKRQNEDPTTYPIQAAVKDAVEYHGSCSTIVGFEAAGEAITQIKKPGLQQLSKVLDDFQSGKLTFTKDKKSKIDFRINSSPKSPLILELLKESVPADEEVVITAKGGTPPYSFLVEHESGKWEVLNSIEGIEGHIRKYSAADAGKVNILAVDKDGNAATVVLEIVDSRSD